MVSLQTSRDWLFRSRGPGHAWMTCWPLWLSAVCSTMLGSVDWDQRIAAQEIATQNDTTQNDTTPQNDATQNDATQNDTTQTTSLPNGTAFDITAGKISAHKIPAHKITAQAPPLLARPAERLLIEQASELIQAGQIDEALRLLEKLLDEAESRLVAAGEPQTVTSLSTQRYIALAQWAAVRTTLALQRFPEAAAKVAARQREPAKLALAQLQQTKDPRGAQRAIQRFSAPALSAQFQLLLSDLYLERGWGVAASQALEPVVSATRIRTDSANPTEPDSTIAGGSLAASLVWQQLTAGKAADEQEQIWQEIFAPRYLSAAATTAVTESIPAVASSATSSATAAAAPLSGGTRAMASDVTTQVVRRLAIAAAMDPQALDAPAVMDWAQRMARQAGGPAGTDLQTTLQEIAHWPLLAAPPASLDSFHRPLPYRPTAAAPSSNPPPSGSLPSGSVASPALFNFSTWPKWSHALERFSVTNDLASAHGAPVAESGRATLPYYPAVHDGIVFVNEMTRIVAYDLVTGAPWPQGGGGLPLFESELSAASYLPLGYPMLGSPRGTLHIENGCLYARMGSPITGRLHARGTHVGEASLSYLVGLDLSKQGSMLPGFPVHLRLADFPDAEFDGPPLAWGNLLIVAVAQRDHVGLRRSLAAFDRITGELRWKSGVLATGSIADSQRANLIAHQQLTLAGGRLYYNTHLGAIVCLDPLSGQTQWLVQYSTPRDNPAFPKPKRYRYRDLTACLVSAGLVFCAPQDAPQMFALDAITGELVWSTDHSSVADAVQLLSADGDSLIVSGDRLVWLDKRTGRVTASFPGNTTPIVGGALPSPRGLGRGFISDQHIYWPTAAEIFVFSTQLPPSTSTASGIPTIVGRIPVRPSGGEGVNVLVVDNILLVASPSRLMAFAAEPAR